MGHFPFKLFYSDPITLPIDHPFLSYKYFSAQQWEIHIQELVIESRVNMANAQNQRVHYYGKHYILTTFNIGDFVF